MERLEGVHCEFQVERPADGVVLVVIRGADVGELGDAPFRTIEPHLAPAPVELYIDARHVWATSIEVSGAWAAFLGANRQRFSSIRMLTASRLVRITADFVRSFAQLDEQMIVTTDAEAFDRALAAAS